MLLNLDNIIFSLQRMGGISVYWGELLQRLVRDGANISISESAGSGENMVRASLSIPAELISYDSRPVRISRYLKVRTGRNQPNLLHSSYYRVPASSNTPQVQTCHDFIYEKYRSGFSRFIHSCQKKTALNSAHGIICVSESTKRDLIQLYPNLESKSLRVIYHGYSSEFRLLNASEKKTETIERFLGYAPFSVYVGDRSAYKNFSVAVAAVEQVQGHRLVLVGGGRLSGAEVRLLEAQISGRWTHLLAPKPQLLNTVLNTAHALLYLSEYEGFGLPIIEAMAAGCPVIAINSSSVPEVSGDAALLLNQATAVSVAEQLQRLYDSDFRKLVIANGLKNKDRFCWERCYRETREFYENILSGERK
jgi:glycosyltransferase involved in cell wall biosynthesis